MARQRIPTSSELEYYNELCSKAISRGALATVRVELTPFILPAHITKSLVFGANVIPIEKGPTTNIPSTVVVKKYLPGVRGMTDTRDRTYQEFKTERAVLELERNLQDSSARIFPEIYSRDVGECDKGMIIIREYLEGHTLEQLAERQASLDGIKWEVSPAENSISEALYPISLLHARSPAIASALKERGLLEFGTPAEANLDSISSSRAKKFIIYLKKIIRAKGSRLGVKESNDIESCVHSLDRRLITIRDMLKIIVGELDVFPHHAMLKRLPDAGGVEIGGVARDLSVYSAPCFQQLWPNPMDMVKKVCPTYAHMIARLETSQLYPQSEMNQNVLQLGTLFASFSGNYRAAAATVHYKSKEDYPVEAEVNKYLPRGLACLNEFIEHSDGRDRKNAKLIREGLLRHNLKEEYKLKADKSCQAA